MTPPRSAIGSDVEAEIGVMVARFALPASAQGKLGKLLAHLGSEPHAPTTVRRPDKAIHVHLADSLVATELPELRAAATICDLGAGAGFPGLALAAAMPDAHVRLVESVRKKCDHIQVAIDMADIPNAEVVWARAEEWDEGLGAHDVVTARALASLPVIAEYAAPLLGLGGVAIAWKGHRDTSEEQGGRAAAERLGLAVDEPVRVQPYPGVEARHLWVLRKRDDTPAGFPRRAGMAQKRPLG